MHRRQHSPPAVVLLIAALAVAQVVPLRGAELSLDKQLAAIYQPLRFERAALSLDGRHLALVMQDADGVHTVIRDTDTLDLVMRTRLSDYADTQVDFIGWASRGRLIVGTDRSAIFVIETRTRQVSLLKESQREDKAPKGPPIHLRVAALDGPRGIVTLELGHRPPPPSMDIAAGFELQAIRIDLNTNQRTVLLSEWMAPAGARLFTARDGSPRLVYRRDAWPRRFEYVVSASGAPHDTQWQPLDELADGPPLAFNLAPHTLIGERSFPLGVGGDRNLVYYASNVGRDTYAVFALDTATRQSRLVHAVPGLDLADLRGTARSPLVFDPADGALVGLRHDLLPGEAHWFDAAIATLQTELAAKLPGREICVENWDEARRRFLVKATAPHDAGRYFLYDRTDQTLVDFGARAAFDSDAAASTASVNFLLPGGERINGFVTRPRGTSTAPPPLVIWFRDDPWQRVRHEFHPDAHALALADNVVLQLNHRGAMGFGLRHATAIRESVDRPIEDALGAIAILSRQREIDPRRIAIGGEGFGGYLALRAVQHHPEIFRCAIAINPALSLGRYALPQGRGLPKASMLGLEENAAFENDFRLAYFRSLQSRGPEIDGNAMTRPVLFLLSPRNPAIPAASLRQFAQNLKRRRVPFSRIELPPLFLRGVPVSRIAPFRKIDDFLHEHMKPSTPGEISP